VTTTAQDPALPHRRLPGAKRLRDGSVLYWWVEVSAIAAFYLVYSAIRNADADRRAEALANALELIRIERWMGIYHERILNEWAMAFTPLAVFGNYFYGSLHFVVTIGVAVYLFRRWPDDWPLWRNTLGIATALALIGFRFWPLMPPRLLPAAYGFVDTMARYPTLWTFNSGAMRSISNQYAAMPSVHCAWALWCACALVPRVRSTAAKVAAAAYPAVTVFVIVLTANHFFLDAPAGFAVLGIGYVAARLGTRAGRGRPLARSAGSTTGGGPGETEPDRHADRLAARGTPVVS